MLSSLLMLYGILIIYLVKLIQILDSFFFFGRSFKCFNLSLIPLAKCYYYVYVWNPYSKIFDRREKKMRKGNFLFGLHVIITGFGLHLNFLLANSSISLSTKCLFRLEISTATTQPSEIECYPSSHACPLQSSEFSSSQIAQTPQKVNILPFLFHSNTICVWRPLSF